MDEVLPMAASGATMKSLCSGPSVLIGIYNPSELAETGAPAIANCFTASGGVYHELEMTDGGYPLRNLIRRLARKHGSGHVVDGTRALRRIWAVGRDLG